MPITDADLRSVLTLWGRERFLTVKNFGEALVCHSVTESAAHRLCLRTQYESQVFETQTTPASSISVPHVAISAVGTPDESRRVLSAIQAISTNRSFVDISHRVVLFDSHRVSTCTACSGKGHARCSSCGGTGKKTCGHCGGMGARMVAKPTQSRDYRGQVTFGSRMERQACSCGGGRVSCTHCSGRAQVNCPQCLAHGSTHEWDTVTHRFEQQRDDMFLNISELPDEILKDSPGQSIWSDFYRPGSALPEMPVPFQERCRNALAERAKTDGQKRRALFHHLALTRVPVFYVVYSSRAASTKAHLWIHGTDHRVHAPSEAGLRGLWNRLVR
jgi:hypothetical protein